MGEATLTQRRPCPHAPYGGASQQRSGEGVPGSLHDHAEDPPDLWAATLPPPRPAGPGPQRGSQGTLLSAAARMASCCPRAPCEPSAQRPAPGHPGTAAPGVQPAHAQQVSQVCIRAPVHLQGTAWAPSSIPLTGAPHTEAEPPVPGRRRGHARVRRKGTSPAFLVGRAPRAPEPSKQCPSVQRRGG